MENGTLVLSKSKNKKSASMASSLTLKSSASSALLTFEMPKSGLPTLTLKTYDLFSETSECSALALANDKFTVFLRPWKPHHQYKRANTTYSDTPTILCHEVKCPYL